jgi:hypothetical protein
MKKYLSIVLILIVTILYPQKGTIIVFSDDFERSVITDKWLFNPAEIGYWGRDTSLKYAGLASLSDSPGTTYIDNTELLAAGGSFAEISSGLNFSLAADAECTFWIKYEIEENFDYLHFQVSKDGVSWVTLETWSSELSGDLWSQENIGLGLFAGESNVRIRFLLVTDPGYNANGSNIDNIEITTSTDDSSSPYIYYTKEEDYYSEKADGFEITTEVVDFSGINYAIVYYKVNGGAETYANPTSVNGSTYYWKLPIQAPGSLVEFRIEAQDSHSPPATGSKGPFYYREGLHQKYDSGEDSYISEVVTTTAQGDIKSVANKFTSFHDDIAGILIRGYDDASQPEDNADMMIHIWADDNGLPGADLIVPFSIPNPATLSDTRPWVYVDLSSYTELDDIEGDYFIGFECGTTPNTTVTRSCQTAPTEEGTFDYLRSYSQYYTLNGSGLIWEQSTGTTYHIRCVTTDNGLIPGTIDPSPSVLSEELASLSSSTRILNVNNIGGYPLDYTASIDYNGYEYETTIHENNFETILGWTSAGTRVWSRWTTTPTVNGSVGYAKVTAATTGTYTHHSYLTSPIINMDAFGEGSTISFQQYKSAERSTGGVEVSTDGTYWFSIYSNTAIIGAMGAPDVQTIAIPPAYLTATTRFRFHATLPSSSGSWAIDNVVIIGAVPYTWLTLDGGATTSGTVAVAGSDPITAGFSSSGLHGGTYSAIIKLSSKYSNVSVPVTFGVIEIPGLAEISTQSATDISLTTAQLQGNIISLGDSLISAYGFCWDVNELPDTGDSFTNEGIPDSTGSFFSNVSGLIKNQRYYFRSYIQCSSGTVYGNQVNFTTEAFYGSGTALDPFLISTLWDLKSLSGKPVSWNKYFIQTADIDASETVTWNEGEGFLPIGDYQLNFTGSYDGQGHSLSGLYSKRPTIAYIGLFGYISGASISNITIAGCSLHGYRFVGAVAGYSNNSSSITGCSSSGSLISEDIYAGGITGELSNTSTLQNSFSSCIVLAGDYAGGITGRNYQSTIFECYATGNVSGTTNVGGIAGYFHGGTIINSYSSGNVSGIDKIGGFVGYLSYSTLTNCYSTGHVTGTGYVGGFIGSSLSSTATNCFWDIETSGQTISEGGLGKTTAEMKTLSTFTNATWDFVGETVNGTDDIWNINVYYNDGYPYLSWQVFPLANPQNVVTSIVEGNFKLDWDDMPDEIGYNVYSSDDPYGEFTLLTTVYVSEYTYTPAESKKFFYITGKDVLKKEPPKVIEIPKKVK